MGLPIKVQECGYRSIVEHEVHQYSLTGWDDVDRIPIVFDSRVHRVQGEE